MVELPSNSITTAEVLRLTMTLEVGEGHEADFPDLAFPDDVPGLILTDYDDAYLGIANGEKSQPSASAENEGKEDGKTS